MSIYSVKAEFINTEISLIVYSPLWISQLIAHLCLNTAKLSAEQCMLLTWILLQKSLIILWLWVSEFPLYSIPSGFECPDFTEATTFLAENADIRELVSLEDVMEELGLGPNGGLMYCMEYPFLVT